MNDTRVPIFVVLDEAHNFVPEEPRNRAEASSDQFHAIAIEERKYAVFLILVSQQPDKLDRPILSECAKKAIMRLDSRTILQLVRDRPGLRHNDPYVYLGENSSVQKWQVLIAGQWTSRPEIFYSAARLTLQGGRDLSKYRAYPDPRITSTTLFRLREAVYQE